MNPRSKVQDISERKEREGRHLSHVETEISKIREYWRETRKDNRRPAAEYSIIKISTILEIFHRRELADLVDRGQPFLGRSEKFFRDIRLDSHLLYALHGKKVSVGELVAGSVSYFDASSFLSSFKALIPDFTKKLPLIHEKWTEHENDWPLPPIIQDFVRSCESLDAVLKARNIVVHELPENFPIPYPHISGHLLAIEQLVLGIQWTKIEECYGALPLTQAAMNASEFENFQVVEEELKHLSKKLRSLQSERLQNFDAMEETWETAAKLEAEYHAKIVNGGSLDAAVYYRALSDCYRRKIVQLKRILEFQETED